MEGDRLGGRNSVCLAKPVISKSNRLLVNPGKNFPVAGAIRVNNGDAIAAEAGGDGRAFAFAQILEMGLCTIFPYPHRLFGRA